MYFNLTFYTSSNYFFEIFFWNFFEIFFEFFFGNFFCYESSVSHVCLPATWISFLSLCKERNPKTRFLQISTNFDNFFNSTTFFDNFRHRFSTFRQYSTIFDNFRQISTSFSSKIRQIFQAAIYKLSKNISENLAAIDRVSKTCWNLFTCKKFDKEQNLLKLTDINGLKYLILLFYPKLKLLQHFFCQKIKLFCIKLIEYCCCNCYI